MPLPYGSWGNGLVLNVPQFNQLLPYITGFLYRYPWRILETSPGVFDWTTFDNQLNYAFNNGLYVGFMIWAGPDAPITAPNSWLANAPYNVPIFTNERDTYAYYFNANYITRYYNMLDEVLAHLEAYPQYKKDLLLYWNSAEGTTGDATPYHGTIPLAYQISDDDWTDFQRDVWNYLYPAIASSSISSTRLLINPADAGVNFDFLINNIPTAFMKTGSYSHTYSNYGNLYYAERFAICRTYPPTDKRSRGEFEFAGANGGVSDTWWRQSATQNYFAMCCNAIHSGLDTINIASSLAVTYGYIADPYVLTFYTKYAGVRNAIDTNEAMCQFRDVIDFNDTTRFPIGTYGAVITSNVAEYNAALNNINSSDDPETQKDFRRSNLIIKEQPAGTYRYLNTSRVNAIRALFPGTSYHFMSINEQIDDKYTQDYGVDLEPGNYFRFLEQYSPNTTSKGVWRVGPTSSYFGRYCRSTDFASSKTEMFLTVDEDLDFNLTEGNNITVTITYYDGGTAIWSLNASTLKGKEEIMVIQNSNSNTFKQRSISIDGFLFGGLLTHSTDLTIRLHSQDSDAIFAMLEFKNNSKLLS